MKNEFPIKMGSLAQLYEVLPEEERLIVDVLRQIIKENLPAAKEKISYNVPFFFGKKEFALFGCPQFSWRYKTRSFIGV